MRREITRHCETAPARGRGRRFGLKLAFKTIFVPPRLRSRRPGAAAAAARGTRAAAPFGRRLGGLAAVAWMAFWAAACGQLPSSPLPTTRVVLPEGFYNPPRTGAEKIPLSAVMVTTPTFAAEQFTASDTGRVYRIVVQPALSAGLTALLTDTFASVRIARNPADLNAALLAVHPAVNLGLNFSQTVFSETITASATIYLLVADPRNAQQLEEFQRQATASAVGGAPWDVGGYYTGFRAGADNGAVVSRLVASVLAADLSRLSGDLRQAALGERLARLQERRPLSPDLMVPKIPYVPNVLEGVVGPQP